MTSLHLVEWKVWRRIKDSRKSGGSPVISFCQEDWQPSLLTKVVKSMPWFQWGVIEKWPLLATQRIPIKCGWGAISYVVQKRTVQKRFLAYLFSCTEMPCKEAGRSLALKVVNRFECKFNRCRFTRPSKAPASTAWSRFPDKSSFVKYLRPWKARVRMASILLALRLRLISDTAPSTWLRASEGTCKEQIYCKKTLFFSGSLRTWEHFWGYCPGLKGKKSSLCLDTSK